MPNLKPAAATASVLEGLPQGPPGRSPPSQALREGLQPPPISVPMCLPAQVPGTPQIPGHLLWARRGRAPPQPSYFMDTQEASDPSRQNDQLSPSQFAVGSPTGTGSRLSWGVGVGSGFCETRRALFQGLLYKARVLGSSKEAAGAGPPRARDGGRAPAAGGPLAC